MEKINQYPLGQNSSVCCGGNAAIAYFPLDLSFFEADSFSPFLQEKTPVLGRLTNTLVSSKGLSKVIITTKLNKISLENESTFSALCGVNLSQAITFSISQGFDGFQALSGIPGTIGGALYSNAGLSDGTCIGDFTKSVTFLDPFGTKQTFNNAQCNFSYRNSFFKANPGCIILEAKFKLPKTTDLERIQKEREEKIKQRIQSGIFSEPSLGSWFTNPKDAKAGKLIEQVGLKGFCIGGAQISLLHANIFCNPEKKAKAEDFYALDMLCRKKVWASKAIKLEREVSLLGF